MEANEKNELVEGFTRFKPFVRLLIATAYGSFGRCDKTMAYENADMHLKELEKDLDKL